MNYIELINQFWRIRRCKPMTAYEADLYYYLMQECNNRNWLNPFNLSTNLICAELGIARKTLSDLRNRLKQKGLIDFEEGQKNKSSASYELVYVTVGNIQGNVLGNIQGNIDGNILGNHLNTKQKQNNITSIIPTGDDERNNKLREKEAALGELGKVVRKQEQAYEPKRSTPSADCPPIKIEQEFERFRKAYPGNKRGFKVEFDNFKKKHSDYQTAVYLLYPALMKLNEWRSQKRQLGQFVPEYANLQTWMNQRRWEVEFEKIEESNETTQKQTKRYDDGDFLQ